MHQIIAKGILSASNGMNIYRGCSYGCIYCDARSTCYQMRHEFEDIEIKINAPELLEQTLKRKRQRCMIGTGAMSDPYLPIEKRLQLTRQCLELIEEYGFGVSLLTKSDLILRDLELLKRIHKKTKCVVQMTMTTYDEELCKKIEPNVCTTKQRFEVLKRFQEEGIPTVCWITPILPYINDTEENIRGILNYCKEAGVYGIILFGIGVTLRDGDRQYFYQKLDEHFPGMKAKYIQHYGNAYEVTSPRNEQLMKIVREECEKHNIVYEPSRVFDYLHKFEDKQQGEQLSLFDL